MHGREEILKYPERLRSWQWWMAECVYAVGDFIGMGRTLEVLFEKPSPVIS